MATWKRSETQGLVDLSVDSSPGGVEFVFKKKETKKKTVKIRSKKITRNKKRRRFLSHDAYEKRRPLDSVGQQEPREGPRNKRRTHAHTHTHTHTKKDTKKTKRFSSLTRKRKKTSSTVVEWMAMVAVTVSKKKWRVAMATRRTCRCKCGLLPDVTEFFFRFNWVLMDFTGFCRVLPDFTGFYWVSPAFIGFCRVLSGVLSGWTKFYLILLLLTRFYRVLSG